MNFKHETDKEKNAKTSYENKFQHTCQKRKTRPQEKWGYLVHQLSSIPIIFISKGWIVFIINNTSLKKISKDLFHGWTSSFSIFLWDDAS